MSVMKGRVFEKVGVNVSTVDGKLSAGIRQDRSRRREGSALLGDGISLIAHMQNPHVPAVHMNTRHMITTKSWFGGGADLTPMFPNDEDARDFHAAMQRACDRTAPTTMPATRNGATSISTCRTATSRAARAASSTTGSIRGDWEADFAFIRDVGLAFLDVYPQIVRRRMGQPWTEAERDHQLVRRGRYVEFNLL